MTICQICSINITLLSVECGQPPAVRDSALIVE